MTVPKPPLPMPPDAARRLLADATAWLRARLQVPIKTLFDTLDDSLFELAEHSSASERQQQYFDGMRECRRRRGELERSFLERLGAPAARHDQLALDGDTLALIGAEELEEELALSGMVARTQQRLGVPLHALNQRVGMLLQRHELGDEENPLGPARLAEAFRGAAKMLQIGLEVRLIVFKLFERHVLGSLDSAYEDINRRLADAGLLPELGQRPRRESPREDAIAATATGDAASDAEPPGETPDESALLGAVLELLKSRQPATSEPPPRRDDGPTRPIGGLQPAIQRAARRIADGAPLPPPRQLAAQLLAEARYEGGAASTQLATVDLVGRLFDTLLRDRTVPRPMQPLMQRMQVPLTRAALADPGVIASTSHPARQLLDVIGEVMTGWCRSADPDGRLLGQIEDTITGFAGQEDPAAQARMINEFRESLDAQQRRAELAEQRTVEATAGRERLWHARRQVHQALAGRLAQAPLPAWVRHLVTHPWANCLVLLWLRQGEESQAYRDAVGFADVLIWCANAGASDVERLRLRALLPVLETQLRQGLATVAYHEGEIEHLVGELREFFHWRLGETPMPAFLEDEPPVSRAPGAIEADPEIGEEQPWPEQIDQTQLRLIQSSPPGTWFEFGPTDHEQMERAKLSWVSPYSGRYLFVNRNGMRVADRRPEELALEIEQGLARILEGADLLQRSLSTVLAQLRESRDAPRPQSA